MFFLWNNEWGEILAVYYMLLFLWPQWPRKLLGQTQIQADEKYSAHHGLWWLITQSTRYGMWRSYIRHSIWYTGLWLVINMSDYGHFCQHSLHHSIFLMLLEANDKNISWSAVSPLQLTCLMIQCLHKSVIVFSCQKQILWERAQKLIINLMGRMGKKRCVETKGSWVSDIRTGFSLLRNWINLNALVNPSELIFLHLINWVKTTQLV